MVRASSDALGKTADSTGSVMKLTSAVMLMTARLSLAWGLRCRRTSRKCEVAISQNKELMVSRPNHWSYTGSLNWPT